MKSRDASASKKKFDDDDGDDGDDGVGSVNHFKLVQISNGLVPTIQQMPSIWGKCGNCDSLQWYSIQNQNPHCRSSHISGVQQLRWS